MIIGRFASVRARQRAVPVPLAGTCQRDKCIRIADERKQQFELIERIATRHAAMYAQMLVGMVAVTGTWWLEERKPKREEVAAHIVNLGWNGLAHLETRPRAITVPRRK